MDKVYTFLRTSAYYKEEVGHGVSIC